MSDANRDFATVQRMQLEAQQSNPRILPLIREVRDRLALAVAQERNTTHAQEAS